MALQINRQELDEFCPKLFRLLDSLGLLPRQLWAKPNEFEKYPRLLLGSIQRYNDVEAGFKVNLVDTEQGYAEQLPVATLRV